MKRYKVMVDRAVMGRLPGEVFEEEIPEDQERRLLDRGSLKVLGDKKSKPKKSSDEDDKKSGLGSMFPSSPKEKEGE